MQVSLKAFLMENVKAKESVKMAFSFSQSFFGRKLFIMCELSIQFRRMDGWVSIHFRKLKCNHSANFLCLLIYYLDKLSEKDSQYLRYNRVKIHNNILYLKSILHIIF